MFLKLRITFTLLSAVCLAAVIPVGTFWDFIPAIFCVLLAAVFFFAMLFCKKQQEKRENPPTEQSTADFFNPLQNDETTKSDKK